MQLLYGTTCTTMNTSIFSLPSLGEKGVLSFLVETQTSLIRSEQPLKKWKQLIRIGTRRDNAGKAVHGIRDSICLARSRVARPHEWIHR
jgi:hypothetical protein